MKVFKNKMYFRVIGTQLSHFNGPEEDEPLFSETQAVAAI